ncbi:MAG: hypothetical protein LBC38_00140 [Oscillospiraceae bacterium]|jgi:hypothetical protein|nr:hypothetical protein [Oscillospiraceae bacterium]
MSPENQAKHDEKLKRINDAIALKEPDRVPMNPPAELFPIFNAGFTVAEVVYDISCEKIKIAMEKYLNDFDPDTCGGVGMVNAGQGAILELSQPKNSRWAGMPGDVIDKNSLQQHIEFPLLLDDEFDMYWNDRTKWAFERVIPRMSGLLEPLSKIIGAGGDGMMMGAQMFASLFSTPEFREMIEKLWKINELSAEFAQNSARVNEYLLNLGYPSLSARAGMAGVPFDAYSDFLRGTILTMEDLYYRPEDIERFIDAQFEATIEMIKMSKGIDEGKHVFMALHKGMDGFLNPEHYRKYYWKHLQAIIEAIIDSGHVPYIYTEGKYNSRLDCLAEVPTGKVYYHFEDVDMELAKSKLGKVACIAGGFNAARLDWGTPEQIRDEVKQLLDVCAPGGGFIFETGCGIGNAKRENVVAMFETVREYGKY